MKTHAGWEGFVILFIVCLRVPVFEFLSIIFDFISKRYIYVVIFQQLYL